MNREELLEKAKKVVTGQREQDYGTPEQNFETIASFWSAYLSSAVRGHIYIDGHDVAAMMGLLKIARLSKGGSDDSWVDLAGYAACGAELEKAGL